MNLYCIVPRIFSVNALLSYQFLQLIIVVTEEDTYLCIFLNVFV